MNDYYCAFDKGIGYREWKIFTVDQYEKVKRMNDEEVKEVCGVNPNILPPDHKFDEQVKESMKDWGKQTYAKDEGEEPFTLEGIQKIWEAIHIENKKRRDNMYFRLKTYILRRQERGEWVYIKVLGGDISHFYTPAKIGSEVLVKGRKIWRIFKILDQRREGRKIIIKNNKTGKHYKIEMGGKVKVGDKIMQLNGKEYLYNGRFEYCEVVKVIEKKRKEKSKFSKGVIYSEFAKMPPLDWVVPKYMKKVLKVLKNPNRIISSPRRHPSIWDCIFLEGQRLRKKEEQKKALTEFHKRPYFKTVVREVKGKPRGEENLEKMMFPCWCSYRYPYNKKRELGEINKEYDKSGQPMFVLSDMSKQLRVGSVLFRFDLLENLIRDYDIEILKGELHLWREVGEYTKKKE